MIQTGIQDTSDYKKYTRHTVFNNQPHRGDISFLLRVNFQEAILALTGKSYNLLNLRATQILYFAAMEQFN